MKRPAQKANNLERSHLNVMLNLKIDKGMKNGLEKLAIRDGRTLSNYIRMVFAKHLDDS